jgi:hypothetical protein
VELLLLLLLLPPTPSMRLPDLSKGKEMSSADLSASHLATALLEKTLLGRKVDSLLLRRGWCAGGSGRGRA